MITLIRKYASHGDIIYMTIFYGLFFFFLPPQIFGLATLVPQNLELEFTIYCRGSTMYFSSNQTVLI